MSNLKDAKREELRAEILRINAIIIKAQEAFGIVEYLLTEETDSYKAYQKGMNVFFYYSRLTYWQITVTELVKLFFFKDKDKTDNREQFNLRHFIKKLKRDGYFGDLAIPESKISGWLAEIDRNDQVIQNLILQRDKLYAHEDRNNHDIFNKATFSEIKGLLDIAIKLIKSIYLAAFKSGISFDLLNSPAQNLKYIIEKLAEQEQTRMEAFRPYLKAYGLENELPQQ